jgi:hypothetical protein
MEIDLAVSCLLQLRCRFGWRDLKKTTEDEGLVCRYPGDQLYWGCTRCGYWA